jgi:ribosomal protein S18 acetylase RimI-like enzyme
VSLALRPATTPPDGFPDLADIAATFLAVGGEFLVAELDGHLVGMGGTRPDHDGTAHVLRVRVHPATRRRGIGRALMGALEDQARRSGLQRMFLDTATNQPEAMAFYESIGYYAVGREHRPGWTWTLVYYAKPLSTAGAP